MPASRAQLFDGEVSFVALEGKKPVTRSLESILAGRKIVLFAVPGAFTPTCSGSHLPRYEELYDCFREQCGVDEIYCLAVNDGFVMNEWFASQKVEKVKMLPDGNGKVSAVLKILVEKAEIGFGKRARRSAFYIEDGEVKREFLEADAPGDPFEVSDADTMIKSLNPAVQLVKRVVVFGMHSCGYCQKTEDYLQQKKMQYNFIELHQGNKMAVMGALKKNHKSTPLIFVDGECIGGYDDFVKRF